MGLYNILNATVVCPRCCKTSEGQIDLYFGYLSLTSYQLGDSYHWAEGKEPQNGGRPQQQPVKGLGYTECSNCARDFFVVVRVEDDILVSCEAFLEKAPYQPDATTEVEFHPPFSASHTAGQFLLFQNYFVAAFVPESGPDRTLMQVRLCEPYQLGTSPEKLTFQSPLYHPQFDLVGAWRK